MIDGAIPLGNWASFRAETSTRDTAIAAGLPLQENAKDPSRGYGTSDLMNFQGVTDPNRIRCWDFDVRRWW